MTKRFYFGVAYHVKDWKLIPWLATDGGEWEFTWLFFVFGIFYASDEELEELLEDD